MKNLTNMFAAAGYFQTEDILPLPNVMYVSAPLATELKGVIMLALIENLWYTLDIESLKIIKQQAEDCQQYCQGHEVIQLGCRHLIDILSQMTEDINDGVYLTSNTLRDGLYRRYPEIVQYFEWVYQGQSYSMRAEEIRNNFVKTIEIYEVRNGQLVLATSSGDITSPLPCLQKILLLNNGNQPHRILYEYTPQQLDSIALLLQKAQSSVLLVKGKLDQEHSIRLEIEDQLDNSKRQLREAEMELQSEATAAQNRYLQSQQENNKLNNLIQVLDYDKQQLNQQCQQMRDALNDSEKRYTAINDRVYTLNAENNQLRRKASRLEDSVRFNDREMEGLRAELEAMKNDLNNAQQARNRAERELVKTREEREHLRSERNSIRVIPPPPRQEVEMVGRGYTNDFERHLPPSPPAPKNINPPKRQTTRVFEPSMVMERFSGAYEQFDLVKCEICLEPKQSYQLFQCSHGACKDCLLQNIKMQVKNESAELKCPKGCGAQEDNLYFGRFLQNLRERKLLEQYNQIKINKGGSAILDLTEKLGTCKVCKVPFSVPKTMQFMPHCGVTTCLKCNEVHNSTTGCNPAMMIALIGQLERPLVCPQCNNLFDMDDKCKHVTCRECEPKKTQPNGICPICSVLRNPIIAHDNSYHRPDCQFYTASPQAPKYVPNNCVECKKLGQACQRPTETFQQYITRFFGPEFNAKIQESRKKNPLNYVQPPK